MLDLTMQLYPYGLGEDVTVFFHDRIHLLLLLVGTLPGGNGCGYDLPLTLTSNQKERKFPNMGDDLTALLNRDQRDGYRWDYL